MERPFSDEEIQQELMGANGNKAPGLDGFTFKFAQTFWLELKGELMPLFRNFFESVDFVHWFFAFSITLVLKVADPSSLN